MSRTRYRPKIHIKRWWRKDQDPPPTPNDERADGEFEWYDHLGDYASRDAAIVMVWDSKLRHHRGARKQRLTRVARAKNDYLRKWGQGACMGCLDAIEKSNKVRGYIFCRCGAMWCYCRYMGNLPKAPRS